MLADCYLSDNVGDAAKEWNAWRSKVVDYAVREKIVPVLLQVRPTQQFFFAGCRGGGTPTGLPHTTQPSKPKGSGLHVSVCELSGCCTPHV
jgi:hypothetical protein